MTGLVLTSQSIGITSMGNNQKNIFLSSEGNAWFDRNKKQLSCKDWSNDDVVRLLNNIPGIGSSAVLEVGASSGYRIKYLADIYPGAMFQGVEPSIEAVKHGVSEGVNLVTGTADHLPYGDNAFDVIIYGFCLYLCDRSDLFKIAAEADRVLKDSGWVVIVDFYSKSTYKVEYSHFPGVYSNKMDYSSLFSWHPDYTVFSISVGSHSKSISDNYTDDSSEWVSAILIRKKTDAS